MNKNQTLESIAARLKFWRANKDSRFAQIPIELKNSIKSIAKLYTYKQIAKALGSYAANLTKDISNNNNTCTFVELPKMPTTKVKATTNKPNTSQVCYTLQHQNGTKLTIETPDYSEQQLATIIKEFVCCN